MGEDTRPAAAAGSVRLLQRAARVLLGLFVLWQMLFLPAFNLLDGAETARRPLQEQRRQDRLGWRLVRGIPGLGPLVNEWLTKGGNSDDKGTLGNLIQQPQRVLRWWAQTTGQEQGWGLFSPNAVDFS